MGFSSMEKIILYVLSFGGSIAAFVAVQRFLTPPEQKASPISDVSDMEGKEISPFARIDPNRSFFDKVDYFFARVLGMDKKLENMHTLLGKPEDVDPLKLLHFKEILAFVVPVGLFLMVETPMVFLAAPIAFILPDLKYSSKIRTRQDDILRAFPAFVDLAALMIESGLDYMTAFDKIVKISPKKGELEKELEKMINEVQLGYSRRDSLRRLAARTGLQEIRSFAGLVIQSDELGTSLVELLRNFSTDMRFRRLNRAEQLAAQASTKMLIPLFLFIFPTVFILLLSPVIYDFFKQGMPF
ncbi:MAG: hypothetical protein Fur0012_12690 [Elusimicrobiota bacterium]